jgi:hypothetical protein
MHFLQTPNGSIYKLTDYDVSPEPGIYRYGALAKARGITGPVKVTMEELQDNLADANDRRARLVADIVRALSGGQAEAIVAGLRPAIVEALTALAQDKTDGLSREDVEQALRNVLGSVND